MNTSIVDVLIENIKTDQQLLQEVETKIEALKSEKSIIFERLKSSRKDVSVMLKYANEAQQAKITELGFDISEPQKSMNTIAAFAFDIIIKAKDNQMTNGELYDAYVKICKDKNEEAEKYSAFNIKCRSLFNTQKLFRKKALNGASSREDMISLNGRVLSKEKANPDKNSEIPKEEVGRVSSKDKQTPTETDKKETQKLDGKEKPVDAKKKNANNKKQNHGKR
ncbi:primase-like DNA-binding domain-containing protein [Polaribacter sp. Z022]|uniref:primase-like DNA-binding domain-containing protein n=1 Tax=Polaribacter sp. Z022 TaxID=2927125 RepID=UPI002020A14D|nr:primase-like DNA-binding domain-containing protein [Polaribacter sp. Z022]MCL7753090.1 hypothetical protein [Polaribacter sp. Z022]